MGREWFTDTGNVRGRVPLNSWSNCLMDTVLRLLAALMY